ncbi:MAG TPA: 50S ribosomal protein L7ae [Bacilli bacterium]|jgi:ribosomal protein L7Ae-like RNA K-turn-binding protein|nr:50S ribosomal protein L7ae [Bacilli bacterium]
MKYERINGYLGLARRANRIALGETALYQCRMGKVSLLLIAQDASDNTRDLAIRTAITHKVAHKIYLTKTELGSLIGKGSVALLGLLDRGLSAQVIHEMEE